MTRYFKTLFTILFAGAVSINAVAQNTDSFLDELTNKFRNYCNTYQWEDIYLHTDRNNYAAGENIWFAVYLIDRQSLKPGEESKIAYIEVLNSVNRTVVRTRVLLDHGSGSGRLTLPDTLRSGPCVLRAYTNYMKNFLPANCFSMKLNVFNAVSNSRFAGNEIIKQTETGKTGPPSLINQPGSGFVTEILTTNPDTITVNIGTAREMRLREGSVCYLFVETRGNINYKQAITLVSNKTTVMVPAKNLTAGINHFTLFNAGGIPVMEKFVYTPGPKTAAIEIASQDNYKRREKISIELTLDKDQSDISNPSHVSISAVPITGKRLPDFSGYMIFGSEYGIVPEEAIRSVTGRSSETDITDLLPELKSRWIDWKTILSGKWPSIKYSKENENHFLYGKLMNKRTGLPDPEQFLFLSIPAKNANFQYSLTDKNGDFTFRIPTDGYTRDIIIQPEKIDRNNTIRVESPFSEVYSDITFVSDTSDQRLLENVSKLKVNYQIEKIYWSADTIHPSVQYAPEAGHKRFYGKPDYELIMDDYIKLPVMQEVFFELLPGVTLKSKKSKSEIIITDPVEFKPFENSPTLFVDGVVVNDPEIIANMDPELVEKIDVVRERYFVGDYLFYGLVNVITRAGNFSSMTIPDYAVRLPYKVIDSPEQFSSPEYSSISVKQNRIPDFRNTLYWNPSVQSDKNGKARIEFWASDFVSDYEIIVQGMSKDGKPWSAKKVITIKK
jgi:hypothetical protein